MSGHSSVFLPTSLANDKLDLDGWTLEPVRSMAIKRFQNLTVYRVAEELSDELWEIVRGWDCLARDTVGKQLLRAADSIGANTAEGTGRKSFQDNRRFVRIGRGSLYETQHWLRRAYRRKLLSADQVAKIRPSIQRLGPLLNGYLLI